LGEEQVVPVVDNGQEWVDTCATVGEYTIGRGVRRRGEGQELVLKTQPRGDGHALYTQTYTIYLEVPSFSHYMK